MYVPSTLTFFPSRFCKNLEGYAAVKDGKIVGVSFVDVHAAKGSRVAGLGPISSLAPGAGKKTLVAACDHVEKLGFSTQVRAHLGEAGGGAEEGDARPDSLLFFFLFFSGSVLFWAGDGERAVVSSTRLYLCLPLPRFCSSREKDKQQVERNRNITTM